MPHDSPPNPPSTLTPAVPSIDATLASQDWRDLAKRLTRYAHLRLRETSWETAEEIAQEAITRLLDPAYASWDRERHPDLFDCLGSIVNGLVANHRKRLSQRAKHFSLREDDVTHDDELAPVAHDATASDDDAAQPAPAVHLSEDRTAERSLSDARDQTSRAEVALALLRARVAADTLCLKLLAQIQANVGSAAAQAKAIGVPVKEIYEAKKRLNKHTQAVARDLARGGDS